MLKAKYTKLMALAVTFALLISFVPVFSVPVSAAAPATYSSIAVNETKSITISTSGESKYFLFVPTVSGSYTYESSGSVDSYGYILDANGNRISIERDGSFRMPNSNVNIAVKTVRRSYTVTFIASGKTVAVFRVPHGESIDPPRAPRIESDNLYSYEFIEWYPVGSVITGDVTYTAVYRRTLLPIKEIENDIGITPSVMRYVVLLAVAVSLFALGIVPASVIAAVYTHRVKKCSSRAKFTKKGKKA